MLKITTNNIRVVRHLSLHYFKSKLIEHFDILWKQNKIFGHNHAVMWMIVPSNHEYIVLIVTQKNSGINII